MAAGWNIVIAIVITASALLSASGKTCWDDKKYNSTSPSPANNWTDIETLPSLDDITKICPNGNKTLKARCYDNKGEPFTGHRNRTSDHYAAMCDATIGLTCTPYVGKNYTCPDFSVQFGCDCVSRSSLTTQVPGTNSPGKPISSTMRSGSDVMMGQRSLAVLLIQAASSILFLH